MTGDPKKPSLYLKKAEIHVPSARRPWWDSGLFPLKEAAGSH